MKKTTLLIIILFGLKSYGQIKVTKALIKQNQDQKNDIDNALSNQKAELAELNDLNKTDSTKIIIYDFETKKYQNSNIVPIVGEPLIFKIQNINRLAYNINITSKDVAIADVYFNPEIKKALEKDEVISPKSEIVNSIPISNPNIKSASFKDKEPKDDNFNNDAKTIDDKLNKINNNNALIALHNNLEKINNDIQNIDKSKIAELAELTTKQTDLKNKLISAKKKNELEIDNQNLENEINKINTKNQKTRTEINDTFKNLNQTYTELSKKSQDLTKILSEYTEFRVLALNPLLRSKDQYISQNINNKLLYNIKSYQDEINNFELLLIKFYSDYNSAINNWSILDELEDETRENVRSRYLTIKILVDEINRNIDTKDLSNKLCRAIAIDNVLQNDKAYEMTSAPIQPQEDYVTFEIDIKNRDDKSHFEYNDERKFVYMEYTQGGVRFDFSTGVVFDFGNQSSTYELVNSGTTNKKIIATSENDFTPTLSGMFHTSFRRNGIWAPGLTLGASLNVETFQLNSLFPGISLLIGKKQKFIITTGPAFKLVDTLNSNYELNKEYPSTDFTSNSALTSKQFKIGFFFGLTYNLTNGQKGTFKISDK